jgi:hypothetical protein
MKLQEFEFAKSIRNMNLSYGFLFFFWVSCLHLAQISQCEALPIQIEKRGGGKQRLRHTVAKAQVGLAKGGSKITYAVGAGRVGGFLDKVAVNREKKVESIGYKPHSKSSS